MVRLLSQWNPGLCSCLHACPCFLSFLVHSFTRFIHRFIYSHTSGCPHSFAPTLSCFQHLLTPVPGWAHRMQGQRAVRQGLALSRAFAFSGRCPSGRGQRAWFVPHLPREAAPPRHSTPGHRQQRRERAGGSGGSPWRCRPFGRVSAFEAVSVMLGVVGDLSVWFPLCCLVFRLLPCSAPLSLGVFLLECVSTPCSQNLLCFS